MSMNFKTPSDSTIESGVSIGTVPFLDFDWIIVADQYYEYYYADYYYEHYGIHIFTGEEYVFREKLSDLGFYFNTNDMSHCNTAEVISLCINADCTSLQSDLTFTLTSEDPGIVINPAVATAEFYPDPFLTFTTSTADRFIYLTGQTASSSAGITTRGFITSCRSSWYTWSITDTLDVL